MTVRVRYLRHRHLERLRHSRQFLAWLEAQATRLSTEVEVIFDRLLSGGTSSQIENLSGEYPNIDVDPSITGTAEVGETLTADEGTWNGSPTSYSFQWLRGTVPIAGADEDTYVIVEDDVGEQLAVLVTATNALGSVSALSDPTSVVTES